MTRFRWTLCLPIVILPATALAIDAYDVAGWAPESSVAVVAWSGADNIQGFAESRLGQLWAEPSVKRFFTRPATTGWAVLREKMTAEFNAERGELLEGILAQVWKRPWVACVFPVKPEKTPSHLGAALIVEAGDEAGPRAEALMKWLGEATKQELKRKTIGGIEYTVLDPEGMAFFGQRDGRWILALGEDGALLVASQAASSFAKSPLCGRAGKALGDLAPFYYACFDTQSLRAGLIRGTAWATAQKDLNKTPPIEAFCAGAGLGAMLFSSGTSASSGECAAAIGFRGADMCNMRYAKADQAHPLPFDFLGFAPVDARYLQAVPGNASVCYLATWDPARIYATTVETIERGWSEVVEQSKATTKPAGPGDLKQKVRDAIGFDPEKELLAHLGNQILFWQQPGAGIAASVLVCEVRDAAGLRARVDKLLAKLPADGIRFTDQEVGRGTLHVLDMSKLGPLGAMLSPCWAVAGDQLVIATQVGAAVEYLQARAATQPTTRPFAENKLIRDLLAEHKNEKLGSIGYVDEVESFMPGYPQISMLFPVLTKAVIDKEPRVRFAAMPPAADIEPHLAVTLSWTILEGNTRLRHERSGVPIMTQTGTIVVASAMTAILLPSLARARELAKRTVCAANLKGVGVAMHTYANEHEGRFPPDFKALVDSGAATPKTFLCPSADAKEGDLDACYVYIKGQTTDADRKNVLAYEKSSCHDSEGGNVLFADGHVEFVKPYERVEELVSQTRERLDTKPAP